MATADIDFSFEDERVHLTRDAYGNNGGGHPARHLWSTDDKFHLRILPYKHNDKWQYFHSAFVHFDVDGNNKQVYCNRSDGKHDGNCPICEWRFDLYKEAKATGSEALRQIAKNYWPRKVIMFQGLIHGREDEGVKVFYITENDHKSIMELLKDDKEIVKFDDRGSYVTVSYKDTKADYPQRNWRVIKKLCGVPVALPSDVESTDEEIAEAVTGWLGENGYDLVQEFTPPERYLPPTEVKQLMESSGLGGTDVKALTAGKGYQESEQDADVEEVEDFDEEEVLNSPASADDADLAFDEDDDDIPF